MDIVVEDYKKHYVCLEVKSGRGSATPVFPLPHTLITVRPDNLGAVLQEVKKLAG